MRLRLPTIILMFLAMGAERGLAQTKKGITLREGVIIDKEQGQVLLIAPDQQLNVVSIKTGATLLESPDKLKPLALINGKLLGQSANDSSNQNNFLLKTIDLKSQGNTIAKDSVFLPDFVDVDLVSTSNSLFSTYSKWMGSDLYILWRYEQKKPLRGIRTTREEGFSGRETGVIKLSAGFAKPMLLDTDQLPNGLEQSILASASEQLRGVSLTQYVSADREHIMTSEKVGTDTSFFKYLWKFYEKNGHYLGQILDYRSYAPFSIIGDTLIYEVGPYVHRSAAGTEAVLLHIAAMKLVNQQQLWKREILDNTNSKSVPPGMRR